MKFCIYFLSIFSFYTCFFITAHSPIFTICSLIFHIQNFVFTQSCFFFDLFFMIFCFFYSSLIFNFFFKFTFFLLIQSLIAIVKKWSLSVSELILPCSSINFSSLIMSFNKRPKFFYHPVIVSVFSFFGIYHFLRCRKRSLSNMNLKKSFNRIRKVLIPLRTASHYAS